MTWVPGEDLLKRVWESIEKLGTGMLSPAQIRREGRARAEVRRLEMLNEATAQMDVAEILAGRARLTKRGEMVQIASADTQAPLMIEHSPKNEGRYLEPATSDHQGRELARAEALLIIEQARAAADSKAINRLVNLRETVRIVEEEIASSEPNQHQPDPDPKPVDRDWLEDWRDGAERTSSDQLRRLWAKLLIEETKSAGTFSLRTLAFLRALDTSDARLIAKIGPLVFDHTRILKSEDSKIDLGLEFAELLALEEMGILSGATGLGLKININAQPGNNTLFRYHKNFGVLTFSEQAISTSIDVLLLSRIGQELIKFGNFATPSVEIERLARTLSQKGFEVKIVTFIPIRDGRVQITTERGLNSP